MNKIDSKNKKTKSIAILGCGWLGERIGLSFREKEWRINASSRNENRLKELSNFGFQPFKIDIENRIEIDQIFFDVDFLIIATTNKNKKAHKKLLKVIKESPIKRVFFISSTSVYQKSNKVITEDSPLIDSLLVEVEKVYLISVKTHILRCGGLIGDNRQPGNFFKKRALIKNPDGIVNLIHYEEIIAKINSLILNDNKQVIHNLIRESKENRIEFYSNAYQKMHGKDGSFKYL